MRPSRKKEREPANTTILCFHGKSCNEKVLRKKGPGKKVKSKEMCLIMMETSYEKEIEVVKVTQTFSESNIGVS